MTIKYIDYCLCEIAEGLFPQAEIRLRIEQALSQIDKVEGDAFEATRERLRKDIAADGHPRSQHLLAINKEEIEFGSTKSIRIEGLTGTGFQVRFTIGEQKITIHLLDTISDARVSDALAVIPGFQQIITEICPEVTIKNQTLELKAMEEPKQHAYMSYCECSISDGIFPQAEISNEIIRILASVDVFEPDCFEAHRERIRRMIEADGLPRRCCIPDIDRQEITFGATKTIGMQGVTFEGLKLHCTIGGRLIVIRFIQSVSYEQVPLAVNTIPALQKMISDLCPNIVFKASFAEIEPPPPNSPTPPALTPTPIPDPPPGLKGLGLSGVLKIIHSEFKKWRSK